MTIKEARELFNNYKSHVENGDKITIGYMNVPKVVEAYEVLEEAILDLSTCERPRRSRE